MLHPSYSDLMRIVNRNIEEGETKIVNSRYSIVLATSKRARQLIRGSAPLVTAKSGEKPLSIAIDELHSEQLIILAENQDEMNSKEAQLEEALEEELSGEDETSTEENEEPTETEDEV